MKLVLFALILVGVAPGCKSKPRVIDAASVRDWVQAAVIDGTQEATDKAEAILRQVGIPSYADGSLGYALYVPSGCQARAVSQLKELYPYQIRFYHGSAP